MANENEPQQKSGQSRRSFLAKMGLGAAALAIAGGPLGMLGRFRGNQEKAASQDFPSEDSIFHPASDPRRKG
ncbi:MAG: twin-arginine translocation signal domain-containing protein [Chloroflexi bacterium]|nr:twin-arginine translocation signal domain-containing protein [Chloroflexota bacterium]MCI0800719.1 twin-arginine translocation signal domain-containing protein [Chloroflexota bacterium]MCI0829700.1 twin-arginine translocation signal domain-containing protein [Chloroflexota bacterium]MCI0864591.1 twin-arginine translocation signal domain-containing protein [Chloroflexota bacterium]MCI0898635.1 twin-arginine translocation signal domain-containing protein [Chloroflexota bacterium]